MKVALKPIKVLHLEDLETDAELISRTLRDAGIESEIKVVDSKEEYHEALFTFNPEIVISDHSLPAFNSMDALSMLRKAAIPIPFILVTGTVSEEFAVEAMREGADDYVLKDRLQRLPSAMLNAIAKYQLERERKNTETMLRNINAYSLDVICSVDENGRFLHVSDACETVWGYKAEELIGRPMLDLVYPDDHEPTIATANAAMLGKNTVSFENRYIRKDGTLVPMVWSARWDTKDRIRYGIGRDATEMKRMEQAFRSEQQRFIDLFLEAPACIGISKGPTHVYEIFNPFYLELTGRKSIIGKTVAGVFPELASQGLITLLDHVFETGETTSGKEMSLKIDREGNGSLTELYFNFLFKPYRNPEGNIDGIFFFAVDVTSQIQSRKKIEDSKKQYFHLVENLPAAAYTCDADGKILLFNKAAVELWGRKPNVEQDLWCGSLKIFDTDNNPIEIENCPMAIAIKEGKAVRGREIIIERPDGSKRHVIPHPSPQFDSSGHVNGAINMLLDVTEQKKIEEEIRKLTLIASVTVNAVIVTDVNGRITWVNKGFERITGYQFDEIVRKKPGDFLQGKETDPDTINQMRLCLTNQQGFRGEILNYNKSGQKYWMDLEIMPLLDSQNRLTGFMGIQQDISERKKSEQETFNLIDRLQRKNLDLQQFSYIVSHNLRSHIAKILGLTSIMDGDPDENQALVKFISQEIHQLDEVVNDINTIVSARKSETEKFESTDFETKLEKIQNVLERQIIESGATITADFSEAKSVTTIKSYLTSIILNLISNAIKFRSPERPLHIHIETRIRENCVVLSVRDNGRGIDLDKNQSKLFGLYKRFSDDSIPGRGIGLNLVKTHAESMGGRVSVESKIDEGTTFNIFIPKEFRPDAMHA